MKKLLFAFLAALLLSPAAFGCDLTPSTAPVIRGLKLHMQRQAVSDLYPKLKVTGSAYTPSFISWLATDLKPVVAFDGVSGVGLTFENIYNRPMLSWIQLKYVDVPFDTQYEFRDSLVDSLRLPSDGWQINDDLKYELRCTGFRVIIDVVTKSITLDAMPSPSPKSKIFKP